MKMSQKLFIRELMEQGLRIKHILADMEIGELVALIRKQLGMSQKILSAKAKIPQPTLSRIETSKNNPSLITLQKVLNALSCDLVLIPVLRESIEDQRKKQAQKAAKKQIRYLQGTMSLEGQGLDSKFIGELTKEKEDELLRSRKLWEDVYE